MPKVTVVTEPTALTWGHFSLADSVGNASEVAQIHPVTDMPDDLSIQKTRAGFQVNDFTITVRIDSADTQVEKTANKTADLLKHEQGHFDLLLLTVRAMARDFESAAASTPAGLGTQVQAIIARHGARATAIDQAYDTQTKNGLDAAEQKRWNVLIATALTNNAARIGTFAL
jgi:hypothetical protein